MFRRLAPLFGLGVVGCSLLVPLDYTGGFAGPIGSTGASGGDGAAGSAAFSGDGGSFSEGGTNGDAGGEPQAGSDSGASGGVGGAATGGASGNGATGGSSGGDAGEAGAGGTDGVGGANGGMGGAGGSSGGEGATGGQGGSAGTGDGGTAGGGRSAGAAGTAGTGGCAGANLMTSEMHCGTCLNACPVGEECLGGVCVSSPCEGLCDDWTVVPLIPGDGYRKEGLGTGEGCFEVEGYNPAPSLPKVTCWEFIDGRTLEINGQSIACPQGDPGATITSGQRGGGYCVHVGPGEREFGGFRLIDTQTM